MNKLTWKGKCIMFLQPHTDMPKKSIYVFMCVTHHEEAQLDLKKGFKIVTRNEISL